MQYRTRQEIFNMAYLGLAMQGWKQSLKGEGCVYRSVDGLKCAIGHCIADEDYNKNFEVTLGLSDAILFASKIDHKDLDFASKLQHCHDWSFSPENMKERMEFFAEQYKLTIPVLGDKP